MRILLIEDDSTFSDLLKARLIANGFDVDICSNGYDALFYVKQQHYHIILLDRLLPVLDGMDFLQSIRKQNIITPVIFITGVGELPQKIEGLNCGADDYLVKPFAFEELLARIHCILRRPQNLKTAYPVHISDLTWDRNERKLSHNEKSCILTAREGALFDFFADHLNQTLKKETIFCEIWGDDSDVEFGNLDNYIYFLRNRLKSLKSTVTLDNVRGIGYKLNTPK